MLVSAFLNCKYRALEEILPLKISSVNGWFWAMSVATITCSFSESRVHTFFIFVVAWLIYYLNSQINKSGLSEALVIQEN